MGFKRRKSALEVLSSTYLVVAQNWEESEAGWGVRPDGYTMHLSEDDHRHFVEDYLHRQKEYFDGRLGRGVTPPEYTRVCGSPRPISVSKETYRELVKAKDKHGIWGKERSIAHARIPSAPESR